MVTFTCHVLRSVFLQWKSPLIRHTPVVFVTGFTAPLSLLRPPFTATLTSIAGSGLNTNFTSTLQVNASRMFARNDTTVECRNLQGIGEESKFTVSGTCKNEESPKLLFMSQSAFHFSSLLHVHIHIDSPICKANHDGMVCCGLVVKLCCPVIAVCKLHGATSLSCHSCTSCSTECYCETS